mmetsp:Transcript_35481/g.86012  ORF Transcript_35481/g.86012 Transcript_35481/m.86012 type:complete len:86 (+) Transcript_35481:113-370(+)
MLFKTAYGSGHRYLQDMSDLFNNGSFRGIVYRDFRIQRVLCAYLSSSKSLIEVEVDWSSHRSNMHPTNVTMLLSSNPMWKCSMSW